MIKVESILKEIRHNVVCKVVDIYSECDAEGKYNVIVLESEKGTAAVAENLVKLNYEVIHTTEITTEKSFLETVNVNKIYNDILEKKAGFYITYNGKKQGDSCKLDRGLFEESILEMEECYFIACKAQGINPNENVLDWELED